MKSGEPTFEWLVYSPLGNTRNMTEEAIYLEKMSDDPSQSKASILLAPIPGNPKKFQDTSYNVGARKEICECARKEINVNLFNMLCDKVSFEENVK